MWQKFHTESFFKLKTNLQNNFICFSQDNDVKVLDLTEKNRATLIGHTDKVKCIELLDANRFVTGSNDTTLRVWDIRRCKR